MNIPVPDSGPDSSISSDTEHSTKQVSARSFTPVPPSAKIYMGIIAILIVAAVNIGYETSETLL